MPDRPLDRALLSDIIQWAGKQGGHKLSAGHSRFMNIGVNPEVIDPEGQAGEGTEALKKKMKPAGMQMIDSKLSMPRSSWHP